MSPVGSWVGGRGRGVGPAVGHGGLQWNSVGERGQGHVSAGGGQWRQSAAVPAHPAVSRTMAVPPW
eukprot:7512477-Alexandrium_andersonii.AAC.1